MPCSLPILPLNDAPQPSPEPPSLVPPPAPKHQALNFERQESREDVMHRQAGGGSQGVWEGRAGQRVPDSPIQSRRQGRPITRARREERSQAKVLEQVIRSSDQPGSVAE